MGIRSNRTFAAAVAVSCAAMPVAINTPAAAPPGTDPAQAGVHALRVAEGDGKKQSGAKDKEEAKRDVKSSGSKIKKGFRDMGGGIKNEFGEAQKDVKDPKRRPKKAAPAQNGA